MLLLDGLVDEVRHVLPILLPLGIAAHLRILLDERTNPLSRKASYRIILSAMTHQAGNSPVTLALREEFRSHLETFYSRLKLAPPYESVEKAIRALTTAVHSLPDAQQARLEQEPALKWAQFRRAFETSGLAKKHRGIIAGLAQNKQALGLPSEYDHFLDLFTASPPEPS